MMRDASKGCQAQVEYCRSEQLYLADTSMTSFCAPSQVILFFFFWGGGGTLVVQKLDKQKQIFSSALFLASHTAIVNKTVMQQNKINT